MSTSANARPDTLRTVLGAVLGFVAAVMLTQASYALTPLDVGWSGVLAPIAIIVVVAVGLWFFAPRWRAPACGLAAGSVSILAFAMVLTSV